MIAAMPPPKLAPTPQARWLQRLRNDLGLTQGQFGQTLGVTGRMISWHENGNEIPQSRVDQILRLFPKAQLPPDSGMAPSSAPRPIEPAPERELPILGATSAGQGSSNVDVVIERVPIPTSMMLTEDDFLLSADGDSLEPYVEDSELMLFTPFDKPKKGVVNAVKREGEHRAKVLLFDHQRGGWLMRSPNPLYEDEHLGGWQVLGYLIGTLRIRDGDRITRSNLRGIRYL